MGKNRAPENKERRKFIVQMAQNVAIATVGGLIWGAFVDEAKAAPLLLRPPGAKKEEDFISLCIKCGLCVEACPYDTLMLAKPGDNKPTGTPYFIPRSIPCYMCEDIPCVPPCPTGALDIDSVSEIKDGKRVFDITKMDMGVAIVDIKDCIAYWGIQCDACYRACPLLDKAIFMEYRQNERTGKHAKLLPVVDPDYCTGCGLCEHACVTEIAAIKVLPREVALGKVGSHYVKGWQKSDEERLKGSKGIQTTVTPRSSESAVESLNEGIDFE